MDKTINSNDYWDKRFAQDWESFQGPAQSRFFSRLAIENLPDWLIEQIQRQPLTLCDWGCAQGDGTDVWSSYIDSGRLTGIDFSSIAIEQASQRFPAIKFLTKNWLDANYKEDTIFDIVFSSNTLEHFHKPYDVVNALCKRASKAVVLALPYREFDRHHEHFYTFLPNNIPAKIGDGFRLVWSRVIDCRNLVGTLWGGDQIVLVFAKTDWVDALRLTLKDQSIEQIDHIAEVRSLNQAVSDCDGKIALLKQSAAERDAQLARLIQAVAERDEKISSLNQAVAEQGQQINEYKLHTQNNQSQIAMMKSQLERVDSGITYGLLKLANRLRKSNHYIKRSATILRSRGVAGLLSAVAFKLNNHSARGATSHIHSRTPTTKHLFNQNIDRLDVFSDHPLLRGTLVIIAGVPFDDVGGGQRGAQLARSALKTGRRVVYLYIYKKFDFELNQQVDSHIEARGLIHKHISETSPAEILRIVSPDATLLIEQPHNEAMPYFELFNLRGMRTVFELIDDWESSLGGNWFSLDVYRHFIRNADVVVGTARVLVEKLNNLGRDDAIYLPNAANEYIFDKYKKYDRPTDLPSSIKRTALYFGSLYGEWFAWDYLQEAANTNKNVSFVIIGDKPSTQTLPSLPSNVLFLGAKNIEELPAYLFHSDCAILPFSPGKISDAVSPIKVFEYLFSGTPVVATKLPELTGYPGVSVAASPQEFAKMCAQATFTEESKRINDEFIFNNSWFFRLDKLLRQDRNLEWRKSVSAIILIHNNKNIIGRCLDSLLLHCAPYLKEVIVVDNASSDDGAAFVEATYPSVRILRNPVNGCSSGRNLGAQIATGRFLAFFDSDQWFTSGSGFEEALSILTRDANVGAIGWAAGWFEAGREDLGGMISDFCPNRAMNDDAIRRGYRTDIGYLGTGGLFMEKVVFDATEGFDLFYDPTCFEDTDLSFQIKKLGLDVCYRDLTGIRHQPHQTTKANSGSNTYARVFKRNAEYFKKKWSQNPEFFLDYAP